MADFKKEEVKTLCQLFGLDDSGTKGECIHRIRMHIQQFEQDKHRAMREVLKKRSLPSKKPAAKDDSEDDDEFFSVVSVERSEKSVPVLGLFRGGGRDRAQRPKMQEKVMSAVAHRPSTEEEERNAKAKARLQKKLADKRKEKILEPSASSSSGQPPAPAASGAVEEELAVEVLCFCIRSRLKICLLVLP
jgi:hypothetical protein